MKTTCPGAGAGYTEAKFSGDPAVITQLVQLCVDTANIDQCTVIFDRMKSGKEREAWKFYEAIVPDMTKVVETNSDLRHFSRVSSRTPFAKFLIREKMYLNQWPWRYYKSTTSF